MRNTFKDDRFQRFIWFDPISLDRDIIEPKKVAALAKDLHATVLHYVATKPLTGRTFYPSKVRPNEAFLNEGDDLLRDIVNECHERDVNLVAYFNCHWMSEDNLPADAEWISKYADGSNYGEQGSAYGAKGTSPCLNSPAFMEASKDILREITSEYDIDGIFYDGPALPTGTCYCDTCKELFKEFSGGADIPLESDWGDPVWNAYIEFRFQTMSRYFRETRAAVREIKEIPVYKNGFAMCASWFTGINLQHDTKNPDIVGGEHFVFYNEPLKTPIFGAGLAAKYYRSVAGGTVPCATYLCYSHKGWDYWTLPSDDIEQMIFEVASNGCWPFVTIDDYTSISDPQNFDGIRRAYKFIEEHDEVYHLPQKANVALVWSQRTADFYAKGEMEGAGGTHHFVVTSEKEYENEVRGFYEILTQAHIPFDIITEVGFDRGELDKYDCIILANTAILSDAHEAMVRKFVKDGGTAIASHETSLYDEAGILKNDFSLKDVMGVSTGGVKDEEELSELISKCKWNYIAPVEPDHMVFEDVQKKYIPNPLIALETKLAGAKPLANFMQKLACRYLPFDGDGITDDPAVTVNEFGKGKCYYFGGTYGEQFFNYNVRDARNMINSVIRNSVDIVVEIKNEPAIDASYAEEDGKAAFHMVNWAGRLKRPVEKIYPIHDVEVEFKGLDWVKTIKGLKLEKEIPFERDGNLIKVTVPYVGNYEVLLLEG